MTLPHYAVESVLSDLNIVKPRDLYQIELIALARGALVKERQLDGSEARLAVVGKKAIITVSASIQDPRRKRFSIAHELGHLEMHRHKSSLAFCTEQDINNWGIQQSSTNLEKEANEFAAALLLPERFFAHLCGIEAPSLDFIANQANDFNVSLTATALRYLYFCKEPCAIIFSQDGIIKWFHSSKEFADVNVFIEVQNRLDPSSLAISFFQQGTIQKTPKQVRASAWFEPGPYHQDATIQEQSWSMPAYNAVLTLLWINEIIEEDNWDE